MSLFKFSTDPTDVSSTPFSDFIRSASSEDKKKVYTKVIRMAIDSQNELVSRVRKTSRRSRKR